MMSLSCPTGLWTHPVSLLKPWKFMVIEAKGLRAESPRKAFKITFNLARTESHRLFRSMRNRTVLSIILWLLVNHRWSTMMRLTPRGDRKFKASRRLSQSRARVRITRAETWVKTRTIFQEFLSRVKIRTSLKRRVRQIDPLRKNQGSQIQIRSRNKTLWTSHIKIQIKWIQRLSQWRETGLPGRERDRRS